MEQQRTTELLRRVSEGDSSASEELMAAVYSELHLIAQHRLRRERPNHTLQPTALVNEAFLRMFGQPGPQFAGRPHFLAFASRIMRNILVDYARERGAAKRGGSRPADALDTSMDLAIDGTADAVELLDLDLAIESLAKENPFPAQVIEMRYFGGMTAEETAEALGCTVHVAQHGLRFGRAWLRRRFVLGNQESAS